MGRVRDSDADAKPTARCRVWGRMNSAPTYFRREVIAQFGLTAANWVVFGFDFTNWVVLAMPGKEAPDARGSDLRFCKSESVASLQYAKRIAQIAKSKTKTTQFVASADRSTL